MLQPPTVEIGQSTPGTSIIPECGCRDLQCHICFADRNLECSDYAVELALSTFENELPPGVHLKDLINAYFDKEIIRCKASCNSNEASIANASSQHVEKEEDEEEELEDEEEELADFMEDFIDDWISDDILDDPMEQGGVEEVAASREVAAALTPSVLTPSDKDSVEVIGLDLGSDLDTPLCLGDVMEDNESIHAVPQSIASQCNDDDDDDDDFMDAFDAMYGFSSSQLSQSSSSSCSDVHAQESDSPKRRAAIIGVRHHLHRMGGVRRRRCEKKSIVAKSRGRTDGRFVKKPDSLDWIPITEATNYGNVVNNNSNTTTTTANSNNNNKGNAARIVL